MRVQLVLNDLPTLTYLFTEPLHRRIFVRPFSSNLDERGSPFRERVACNE